MCRIDRRSITTQALENPCYDRRILDAPDRPQLPAAARAGLNVDGEHPLDEAFVEFKLWRSERVTLPSIVATSGEPAGIGPGLFPALAGCDWPARLVVTGNVELVPERFGLAQPRVVVLGLNPHAGEGRHLGSEQTEVISPTLNELVDEGIRLAGRVPADNAFRSAALATTDAILAMCHDRGLPVLKHAS
jgi:4-hydroxy-L-threonine phosphate dehydrogenase PdxA